MIVECPNCGKPVTVSGIGRKRLNIPLKNVLECLRAQRSVSLAAGELGCSPAHIFGVLKASGLKLKDVIERGRNGNSVSSHHE